MPCHADVVPVSQVPSEISSLLGFVVAQRARMPCHADVVFEFEVTRGGFFSTWSWSHSVHLNIPSIPRLGAFDGGWQVIVALHAHHLANPWTPETAVGSMYSDRLW